MSRRPVREPSRQAQTPAVGRLRPTVALEAAQAEMSSLARNLWSSTPRSAGRDVNLVPLREEMAHDSRRALLMLLGATLLVALIGRVNVANLLLVRAVDRERDLAVRATPGAGRAHPLRGLQLIGRHRNPDDWMAAPARSVTPGFFRAFGVRTAYGRLLESRDASAKVVVVTRMLAGFLFGVAPTDAATLVAASVLLPVVAAAASWLPAHRAAAMDPAIALRSE